MSAKANYYKLGLFIIVGFTLIFIGVLILGSGKFFKKRFQLETYVNETVQGIDIGSKVKFRGVTIGNVNALDFTGSHYQIDRRATNQHSYVRIQFEIDGKTFGEATAQIMNENLADEVAQGLRIRVTAQGVTGTSYLEIDYLDPVSNPTLPIQWEPKLPYIPAAQSVFNRIVNTADALIVKLSRINYEGIASNLNFAVVAVTERVKDLQFAEISTNAVKLLDEVRESNRKVQALLVRPEIETIFKDFAATGGGLRRFAESPELTNSLVRLDLSLRRVNQLLAGKDADIQTTLENLRSVSENLRELSENAKRYPAQLLFGEPPPRTKVAP